MGDRGFLQLLLSAGPPLWVAVMTALVFFWRGSPRILDSITKWIEVRAKIKADLLGGALQRIDRLEISEQRCREELATVTKRLAELEGYNIGSGRARQDAAAYLAAERIKDRDKASE